MDATNVVLYHPDGRVAWERAHEGDRRKFGESCVYAWDVVAPADVKAVKALFGLALMKSEPSPQTFRFSPAKLAGEWLVRLEFHGLASTDFPVLGVVEIFSAAAGSLSKRERQVARLLPELPTKKIAAQLDLTVSTVDTLKSRLAAKVGMRGPKLIAWCAEYRRFLD